MFCYPWPDAPDPHSAARSLQQRPGLVWLDGGPGLGPQGRFSFVGSDPSKVHKVGQSTPDPIKIIAEIEESELRNEDWRTTAIGIAPPLWIGYIAYDATWSPHPRRAPRLQRESDRDVLWMGRYDALLATDHLTGDSFLVGDDEEATARLRDRLAAEPQTPPAARVHNLRAAAPHEHLTAIQRAMEHIEAGDIYQVNLARAWRARLQGSPLSLWENMRTASPVPFGLYLDSGEQKVLARTMERFLRWDRKTRELSTRPIKGTIARSGSDDGAAASTLTRDAKERAEHSMIVDLMRNDLSRVAIPGTVAVEKPLEVEPYRRLSHLVSTVRCTTQPDKTAADILEATFPPGSVTGAPKERAIEIIEELEPVSRGVYTGALGFLDREGGLSLAVAIRTAIARGEELVYFAGGGLVEASVPEREVAETELKARVFLDALSADLGA